MGKNPFTLSEAFRQHIPYMEMYMNVFSRMKLWAIGPVALLAVAAAPVAASAHTNCDPNYPNSPGCAFVTVQAGLLSESVVPVNVGNVVDGQTVAFSFPISVNDSRGNTAGDGWNLSFGATPFTDSASHTLGNLTMTNVDGNGLENALSPSFPTIAPDPTNPDPTKAALFQFFGAKVGSGVGSHTVTPSMKLLIPSDAPDNLYVSTFTVAIADGPGL
jgi:hypothetical protein